ncbi:MAG: hypothetical protein H6626_03200 [Pseudobdellovibrionaceae bacterium]|nr:MAG: hypothetical protein H6626_03200 [Pseudobdellovibrionaceae bacterium]
MRRKNSITWTIVFLLSLVLMTSFNNCKSVEETSGSDSESASMLPPAGGPNSKGSVTIANESGYVRGWAYDPDSPNSTLKVAIYIDGTVSSGTLAGYAAANETGGTYNGHYFSFNIPKNLIDNQYHFLYAYIDSPTGFILLSGTPRQYVAFAGSSAGQTFYNSQVYSGVQVCTSCHTVGYDIHFGSLLNPNPFAGGSASNNTLINNASGQGHGGGSHCASKSTGLCAKLQEWWNIEFGP